MVYTQSSFDLDSDHVFLLRFNRIRVRPGHATGTSSPHEIFTLLMSSGRHFNGATSWYVYLSLL